MTSEEAHFAVSLANLLTKVVAEVQKAVISIFKYRDQFYFNCFLQHGNLNPSNETQQF